jgi:hypothetical protein
MIHCKETKLNKDELIKEQEEQENEKPPPVISTNWLSRMVVGLKKNLSCSEARDYITNNPCVFRKHLGIIGTPEFHQE